MVFVSRRHLSWKPEHMRGTPHRDCYWCGELGVKKQMTMVKDGPITWHFCNADCVNPWFEQRRKKEWREFLTKYDEWHT